MDTSRLKKFAQFARRSLIEQVQSKLKFVLAADSAARREHPKAIKELEQKLSLHKDKKEGEKQLIEQVAYTWFNRFCALRFMDVNQYNRTMVLSPISGQFQPELLAEAKAGHLDDVVFSGKAREKIQGLLSGSIPSRDGQAEAYRMMIVAVCNDYHRLMPYLFQRIEDYTELLMPDDLLSGNSILAYTREAMTPENCESVESIGWLYQFYISEKKDLVFEGLKKNEKITPENIPAATQLFTPHWIVKYLVENSLGRLWMLNNPNSKVIEQMEYYIKPVEDEADFLRISTPEEIKLCDPAVGSGHMLTYAYDLLYAIYLDASYDAADIPELILTKNLYGIEIDERAAELAAFALSIKAIKGNPFDDSNNRRRFFRNPIKPNICRLENVKIDQTALEEYIEFAGRDLFTQEVIQTLTEFEEADNFGSLIQPTLKNPTNLIDTLEAKDAQVDLFLKDTHESILKILKQAKYLSPIYHVVTANPPYMGNKGMNEKLDKWVKKHYPNSKYDLYSTFIERNIALLVPKGITGMITMQSWMFLTSFEKLRIKLIDQSNLLSMAHLGTRAFDSIGGEVVSTTAFTVERNDSSLNEGVYYRLTDGRNELSKSELFKEYNQTGVNVYKASKAQLKKIPGSPFSYWLTENSINAFENEPLEKIATFRAGLQTGDNDTFLRFWFEVEKEKFVPECTSRDESIKSNGKWFPHNKGGGYRKWYGNKEYVINWENDGKSIKDRKNKDLESGKITRNNSKCWNQDFYFKHGLTWSSLSSSNFALRDNGPGFLFDTKGQMLFPDSLQDLDNLLGFLNSSVAYYFLSALAPTLDFNGGVVSSLPYIKNSNVSVIRRLVEISKLDWDMQETSWDFKTHPLMNESFSKISEGYSYLKNEFSNMVSEFQKFETENNQYYASLYGLTTEAKVVVEKAEVSLNCNPYFKYGVNNTNDELELLVKRNIIIEFVSYSVGCMFGRYSLDKNGLILANQGDTLEYFLSKISFTSFIPDEDNVIPIINFELEKDKDEYWFGDDISERFKVFLKVTFGAEHFTENLGFVEEAIGKNIKSYFIRDFYEDHHRRYKKRPIYWMFSSPKGSFNALIYMHRYQPDTASVVLNDYLREFRTKLEARKQSYEQVEISASASQKDKTQAIKAVAKINKVLEEINDYEHDVLYPLAGEKIEIDLDDGVKHNYPLFGKALKKITGLS